MFGRSAQVVLHGFRQLAVGQLFVASRLLALVGSKALIEVSLQLLQWVVRAIARDLTLLVTSIS